MHHTYLSINKKYVIYNEIIVVVSSILYLKYQFERSSRVIFLQINPHNYFKLIHCMSINGQTAVRHGPDARAPQLWPMHVMLAC
jgi:hypothetical protein